MAVRLGFIFFASIGLLEKMKKGKAVVRETTNKGLGLFAATDINTGDVILSELPVAFYSPGRCQNCHAPARSRCSSCQDVCYCSRECQKSDIAIHRAECRAITRMRPRKLLSCMRIPLRLMLQKRRIGDSVLENLSGVASTKRKETFLMIISLLSKFCPELGELMLSEMQMIFAIVCTNGYSILEDDQTAIGTGFYRQASFVNHSCMPNTVVSFGDNAELYLRAVRPIEIGQEIELAYLADLAPDELLSELAERYAFRCSCELCSMNPDPRGIVICPENSSIKATKELVNVALSRIKGDPCNFESSLQILDSFCGPQHSFRFSALTCIQQGLLDRQEFSNRTLHVARLRLEWMRRFLFANHPATGVQAIVVSRLLENSNDPKDFREIDELVSFAKKTLSISLGETDFTF